MQKSTYTKRIIPCLDVKEGRVVKGTNFEEGATGKERNNQIGGHRS